MQDVVIAGYLRTAQSRSRPNDPSRDWFHNLRADELLAKILPELISRSGISPQEIDDFIVGSATGVGEQWTYGGRTPLLLANLPETIASKFVDQQCASSMAAVHMGFMEVAMGFADVVLIGGMEHMTRLPMAGITHDRGLVALNEALFLAPEYRHWDMPTVMNMGLTAEKLSALTGYTRREMEEWAVRSHQRAAQAQADGFFDGEILPVEAPQADGSVKTVDRDQAVRKGTTMEDLAKLRPPFKKDGVITAGVSSPLNAAATGLVLMSKARAQIKGIKPLATIRSLGFVGVDPTIMGQGPVPASRMALDKIGLDPKDVDYWEINEAFAIVALNCIRELGLDPERVNIMGGGLALGHPLGATGGRLIGTLARILGYKQGRWGCANACVGGGQGVATVLEREEY
ncbi:MAG: acetyl-CoA C-acetyltransferase [Proteobacteria bacterium]|nr:acetyl-CoA C-acetyltransferase [Pseudomonadota bacterium]MBU4385324.1 acetyl-CoA C-acetyltransferase [Pseudomonadota bacterium]MBU4603707.1 acetyl-CoA C-acetyltransferase [Pseudomonadota bacterium]MCG2764546.1 acetyl-CoA C-acetyltransferase [Desulfarculaceae bacterium]